ncbi:MAG: hypothetical protein ACYC4N_25295 [Pirellulaceae bacterium]
MRQSSPLICSVLLAVCATEAGCKSEATWRSANSQGYQSSDTSGAEIDQVLQKGMDEHAAFSALGVVFRRERIWGSGMTDHHSVLGMRFPGKEVQLDFGLSPDGWRLEGWALHDHIQTKGISDWVPTSSAWARRQDEKAVEMLRQFHALEQEDNATQVDR